MQLFAQSYVAFALAVEVKLQVDDIHELYDGSGLLSSGQWWSHVYTAHASMYLALYAENIVSRSRERGRERH